MDGAFIVLVIILIILLVVFITYSILSMLKYREATSIKFEVLQPCQPDFSTLEDISTVECCYINNTITNEKYVKNLNMVVSTQPTYYVDVCKQLCRSGFSVKNQSCVNINEQTNFSECIDKLKPIDCKGSVPVAYSGITYYYPKSFTNASCENKGKCSI